MKTWGDLLEALKRAIDEGKFEEGEELLDIMQREAGLSGDLGQESSCLFYEGMFADAKGELHRAEACFAALVNLDRRDYGELHRAVADTLNSLAIVQKRLGKLDAAADALAAAADIYVEEVSEHRVPALVYAGNALLDAGRTEEAKERLLAAMDHPEPPGTPWHKSAAVSYAHACVTTKSYLEMMSVVARALARPLVNAPPFLEAQSSLWLELANVSVVFGLVLQAAFAYRCCLFMAQNTATADAARRGLDALDVTFDGPLDAMTVVHYDGELREAHVGQVARGLFVVRDVSEVAEGDIVELSVVDGALHIEKTASSK